MKKNRIRPGELVTCDDVASYGSLSCSHCSGTGYKRRDLKDKGLCDCARDRFLAANMFRIFPDADNDVLRWGPNPPTADEIKQATKEIVGSWDEFKKLSKPKDKLTEEKP